jgi:O-antigen/teichoic acid export membrane protein
MLPALFFPELMLRVLFDSEFVAAAAFVYLFVLSEAFVVVSSIHQALLIGLDDFGVNVVYVLAGQLVMCVLIVALVPSLGVAAVGVAMIVDHALVLALTTRRLRRRHGMDALRGLSGKVLLVGGALAAVGAIVPSLPSDDPAIVVARAALLAICLGVGSVLAYRAAAPITETAR